MMLVKTRRLVVMRKQHEKICVVTLQTQSGMVPFAYAKHRTKVFNISADANLKDLH